MGRKGVVPAGKDFLPGTSAEELGRKAREEKDGKSARKCLAAYHRKRGMGIGEIADMLAESYHTVRRWLVGIHNGGLDAIPRRKSPGTPRKIPLDVRQKLILDVYKGPQAAGLKANVWTFKLLHRHLREKYGISIAYSTAAKNFKEMGIRLKVPRPVHPMAASAKERLAFQKGTREKIEEGAKDGFHSAFVDEGHIHGYKNGHAAAGLSGVEAVRTSSVGRAHLTVFVAVGNSWFFARDAPAGNSDEYVCFLDRLSSLFGKVLTIDDNAAYHVSGKSSGHIKENSDRLRRIGTLPYTPNENAAEPQIRILKAAMSNVGLDSVGAIRSGLEWCIKNNLIDPVKFYKYADTVDSPRISPRRARAIAKRLEPGEHFVYAQRPLPDDDYKVPTINELRAEEEKILPPEKRAELPDILANSNLPANFLARLSPILLA